MSFETLAYRRWLYSLQARHGFAYHESFVAPHALANCAIELLIAAFVAVVVVRILGVSIALPSRGTVWRHTLLGLLLGCAACLFHYVVVRLADPLGEEAAYSFWPERAYTLAFVPVIITALATNLADALAGTVLLVELLLLARMPQPVVALLVGLYSLLMQIDDGIDWCGVLVSVVTGAVYAGAWMRWRSLYVLVLAEWLVSVWWLRHMIVGL